MTHMIFTNSKKNNNKLTYKYISNRYLNHLINLQSKYRSTRTEKILQGLLNNSLIEDLNLTTLWIP